MQITGQNIEELIVLYVDGELDPPGAAGVLDYVSRHPQYAAMLEDYQQAILAPDMQVLYPGKEDLIRPEPAVAPLRTRGWGPVAAAAAILLLFSVWVIKHRDSKVLLPAAEKVAKNRTVPAKPPASIASVAPAVNAQARHSTKKKYAPVQQPKNNDPDRGTGHNAAGIAASRPEQQPEIRPLPSPGPARMPSQVELNAAMAARILPQAATGRPDRSGLPEWLPGGEEKLDIVNELVAQFNELKERVADGGRTLKNASFALRIGEKEIGFGKKNNN